MTVPYWEWEPLCIGDTKSTLQKQTQYLTFAFAVRVGSRASRKLGHINDEPDVDDTTTATASSRQPSPPSLLPPLEPVAGLPAQPAPATTKAIEPLGLPLATQTFSLAPSTFGHALTRQAALEHAASHPLVIVGEVYAMPRVIQFETELLTQMCRHALEHRAGAPVYLVLEHFNFRHQPMLDDFMNGMIDFDALVALYAEDGTESHDLEQYRALLQTAREQTETVQLVAGFLPRPLAQAVLGDGLTHALETAKREGYLREDETGDATEAHYSFFESLVTGRPLHGSGDGAEPQQPSNLARRLFPAQVLKSAAMAHHVATLTQKLPKAGIMIVCGSSHMMYGHGVPERLQRAVPRLRGDACCRIVARQEDARLSLDDLRRDAVAAGLAAVFGEETNAADLAFIYK